MSSSSIQTLHQKFQRRFNSLREADFESLQPLLSQFKTFFYSEPVLQQIQESLVNKFSNLSDKVYQIFNSPSNKTKNRSDLESTAIAFEVLFDLAETERNRFRGKLQASVSPAEFGIGQCKTQIEIDERYTRVFKSLYLDKFYYYVDEQLDEIEEAERTMTSRYEEQEYRILKKLVENGRYKYIKDDDLANSLSISKDDLYVFLEDFYSKQWIGMIAGGSIQLYPAGITAFHKWESANLSNSTQNSGDIYNNIYHAAVMGVQQGGQNNTQNNIQNINPDFTRAINDLLNLIENSSLAPFQKMVAKSDVELIKGLADLEKSPEILQLANSKIEAVIEVISMTADMTSLGMVLMPAIQAVFGN